MKNGRQKLLRLVLIWNLYWKDSDAIFTLFTTFIALNFIILQCCHLQSNNSTLRKAISDIHNLLNAQLGAINIVNFIEFAIIFASCYFQEPSLSCLPSLNIFPIQYILRLWARGLLPMLHSCWPLEKFESLMLFPPLPPTAIFRNLLKMMSEFKK